MLESLCIVARGVTILNMGITVGIKSKAIKTLGCFIVDMYIHVSEVECIKL